MTYHSPILAAGLPNWAIWSIAIGLGVLALVVAVYAVRTRRVVVPKFVRHPFAKYVIFSVLAHAGLAVWLLTSQIFEVQPIPPGRAVIVVDVGEDLEQFVPDTDEPWDNPASQVARGAVPELPERTLVTPQQERPQPEFPPQEADATPSPFANSDEPTEFSPSEAFPEPSFAAERTEELSPINSPDFTPFSAAEPDVQQPEPQEIDPQEIDPQEIDPREMNVSTDSSPEVDTVDDPPAMNFGSSRFDQAAGTGAANDDAPQFDAADSLSQQIPTLSEVPKPYETAEALSQAEDRPGATLQAPRWDQEQQAPAPTTKPVSRPIQEQSSSMQTLPLQSISTSGSATAALTREARPQSIVRRRPDGKELPVIYRDRWAEDRVAVARLRGGSEETEAAVQAALRWLASVQADDGRWDASRFGSGQGVTEGGHDRGQVGIQADTAITGLALLAFMGAGHTHAEGQYADAMGRGIEFLLEEQRSRSDGSLVGQATGYAAMYCHGIGALCLSEAWSLTGDETLRPAVRDAIRFTLQAQHAEGGWRYRPQEPGDTSQLGWQLMALTSAHYAGFAQAISAYPTRPWTRASRFLDRVSQGSRGGLASYKPGMRPTRPMTAEALLCRLLLNTPTDHPRVLEAANSLLQELPGDGRLNYYYWYYGTLGLYHLQDDHWQRWNAAVTRTLLGLQESDGRWPTENSVWGNAGGAVYTTALGAMTLEVYYRYRPFSETNRIDRTARRP